MAKSIKRMTPIRSIRRRVWKWRRRRLLELQGGRFYKVKEEPIPKTQKYLERERLIRQRQRQEIIDAGYGHLLEER